ncbi:MAG: TolC family protein [Bdellovibrionales bacterium]|nr:TolC family protein [Bdellovibrionales bacterium]
MRAAALLASVIFLLPVSGRAAPVDDDGDTRTNVSVSTKRAAIPSPSLPRLARLALENSPNVAKAQNALDVAKLELENARVTFLPSLDLEALHGLGDSYPTTKGANVMSPYSSRLSLVLSENLYDNGANLTKLRIAENKAEQARLDFEYKRDEQVLRAAQAYLEWSASLRQREIDEQNRNLLRAQFNQLDALYKQGLKTKRDLLRIETEMRRLEMDVLRRDNEVDLNFQRLAGTVGLSRDELLKEDVEGEEPKPYSGSDSNAPQLKADQHVRARILAFGAKVAELETDLARREYWPQVFLDGKLGYISENYLGTPAAWEDVDRYEWSALITLRYNLFDFGARGRKVEIARVKARNVTDDNKQILLDLSNDLRDIWNRLREYRENVKMSRELLVIEQQSYSILEAEYRNGRATYLDLITNLKSLIDARSRFTASYFGLRKQQMLYSFHKGELNDVLK